jgi:hypothetical protein
VYTYSSVGTGLQIDPQDPVVEPSATGRRRAVQAVVLEKRVLHDAHQKTAVRCNRQTLHPAIGLAAGDVEGRIQLERISRRIHLAARIGDQKGVRHRDAPNEMPLAIELVDRRAVFVGHEEVSVPAEADTLRIEPQVELRGIPDEVLVAIGLEEAGVEQTHLHIGRRWVVKGGTSDREVHEMKAIEVGHVGSTVERSAIGYREKHVVEAGVGQSGSKAAERRPVDAIRGIVDPADRLSGET